MFRTPKIVISTCEDSEAPRAVNVAPRITWERRSVLDRAAVKAYVAPWALRFLRARS